MKKTFFCDQGEFLGGAERFLIDTLNAFTPQEIRQQRPVLIGGKNPKYKDKLDSKIPLLDFDFPPVRGGVFGKIKACFLILKAAYIFARLANKEKAVQYFTNTPRTHFVVLVAKIFFGLRGRWIVFFHDFTTRPDFLLRQIAKKADILVANSMPTRAYLRTKIEPAYFSKIRIIENGIDLKTSPPASPPDEIKNILMLGRIDPRKGQMYVAEAADLLLERNPDLQFTFVGSSVPEDPNTVAYEKELRTFVKNRNCNNIRFIAEVSNPFDEISKCDCLVSCSTEPETFGRILTEAYTCGKLVIAFDQTGPRDIYHNYENFLQKTKQQKIVPDLCLTEIGNAMSLAEKIGYFADNPKEAEVFTTHAREFVETNYSLEQTKKQLLGVLG